LLTGPRHPARHWVSGGRARRAGILACQGPVPVPLRQHLSLPSSTSWRNGGIAMEIRWNGLAGVSVIR